VSSSLIELQGVKLEVQHIPGASAQAPLVFLHEGLGSVAMWRNWPAAMCGASGRTGWVYSRRGYGQSEPVPDVRSGPGVSRLPSDYMQQEAWQVLPALLAQLGIEKPVLIGHSDGATIALLHASRHSLGACVAMAPHVMVEDVSLQAIRAVRDDWLAQRAQPGGGALRSALARYHADPEGAFWQWNDVWLSSGFASFDIRSDCARISCPLLALQGTDDNYGTMAQIDEIAQRVPHAATLKLTACGHSPHKDQSAMVTAVLAGFLAGLAPESLPKV
jgi:pimeloyl-ACP methyl ester carboxylesterase